MKVIFSNRAYTTLITETIEKITTETGGVFLGFFENGNWYVVETIDPGPKSIFEVAYFEYDQQYINHLINKIARLYKRNLFLIGLWHRHPGSFDVFSGTDDKTNLTYAKLSQFGAISALVNIDPNFRLTMYHVSSPLRYKRIQFEVGDELFPEDSLSINDHNCLIEKINSGFCHNTRPHRNKINKLNDIVEKIIDKMESLNFENDINEIEYDEHYYEELLDVIFDDLDYLINELKIHIKVKKSKQYLILVDDNDEEGCPIYVFKQRGYVIFVFNCVMYKYEQGLLKKLLNEKPKKKNGFFEFLNKIIGGDDNE